MDNPRQNLTFGAPGRVSARVAWPHESHEFTPWLAENVGLLGDALGLALELKAREHKVGRYSLDLLLSDSAQRIDVAPSARLTTRDRAEDPNVARAAGGRIPQDILPPRTELTKVELSGFGSH